MSTLAKLLLLPAVLVVGILAVALAGDGPAAFESDPLAAATTGTVRTDTGSRIDVSGPCDEAEHVNDPRCTGITVPSGTPTATTGLDISGPCDEAEHAGDPRCTGAGRARHDNSGPGSANSRRGSDDDRGRGRGRGRGGDSR
jgi:hypothetical protein